MVLPTPSFRTSEGFVDKTMGLMMYEWFLTVPRASDIEYIVNRTEREYPHTTYGELLWGLPAAIAHRRRLHEIDGTSVADDLSDTKIVIVSNQRHLKRVRWIIELMLPQYRRGECQSGFIPDTDYTAHYSKPAICYVASSEPPSSLWHEFLAYSKLGLMWAGLVKP